MHCRKSTATDSLTVKLKKLSDLPIGYLANSSDNTATTQFGTVALGAPLSYYVRD